MENSVLQQLIESQSYRNRDGSYNRLRKEDKPQVDVQIDTNQKIVQSLDELLVIAVRNGASDVHISAGAPPRYRIDGELRDIRGYAKMSPENTRMVLSGIVNEEMANEFEEVGDLDFAYQAENIGRFRCNLYKQRNCWSGVFRQLSSDIPTPQAINLPSVIVDLITKKRGLVLVTGPTGSGKSTTLASLIGEINHNYRKNIITLEDPVEYVHTHDLCNVNQREMGVDSKNFAAALRSALREDPDVILVGEMRDFETISTAITAAETGHLVFSTLHTIGASATIDRILDTYPVEQQQQARGQLATVLEGVISQQLIKKAEGRGRVAAFEIMTGSTAIRSLIRENKVEQIPSMIQTSAQMGMRLMDDDLMNLVRNKVITVDSAVEYAVDKKKMRERLGG